MDLKESAVTRRRGAALENAILEAAWAQLVEAGYPAFTFEAVAARAGTSRPVLYRRWPGREDLLLATLRKFWWSQPIEIPDTGSLRDDAVTFLVNVGEGRWRIMAMLGVQLMDYFRDSGKSFSELRDVLRRGATSTGTEQIVANAVARGDIPDRELPSRVVNLPFDLMRGELIMTMRVVPKESVVRIVDEVWLPLLRQYGARI